MGWEGCFVGVILAEKNLEGGQLFQHPQVGGKMERRRGWMEITHLPPSLPPKLNSTLNSFIYFSQVLHSMFELLILFQSNTFFLSFIKYLYKKISCNKGMRVNLFKLYFLSLHFSTLLTKYKWGKLKYVLSSYFFTLPHFLSSHFFIPQPNSKGVNSVPASKPVCITPLFRTGKNTSCTSQFRAISAGTIFYLFI